MRPSLLSRRPLLFTAFAALVAFASPGVDVQPAAAAGERSAAGQCSAGAAARSTDADIEAFLADLRRETAGSPAAADAPEIVVLNNRGYNYNAARRGIALDAIRAEAAGAR
jgi:hypothetical protein